MPPHWEPLTLTAKLIYSDLLTVTLTSALTTTLATNVTATLTGALTFTHVATLIDTVSKKQIGANSYIDSRKILTNCVSRTYTRDHFTGRNCFYKKETIIEKTAWKSAVGPQQRGQVMCWPDTIIFTSGSSKGFWFWIYIGDDLVRTDQFLFNQSC